MRNIVVLTGAGISAESGIETFRGAGGLWEGHAVEDVATPEAFARDPGLVHQFYNLRRQQLLAGIEPNPAHVALARLEREFDGEVLVVTQNIDDLHERGGSENVIHMHGELLKSRCVSCGEVSECRHDLTVASECPRCHAVGTPRPHVVWFGEIPLRLPEIERALIAADLFIAVGTSGRVYPAAGFVRLARAHEARTIEINLEETGPGGAFQESRRGRAGEILPDLVGSILARDA
ncbi:MAG: NAD-dependent deacylase [Akkermansiaceae bacterium]|nr:NAD-dependent deacylase [Akkermansiaceae bacterium]